MDDARYESLRFYAVETARGCDAPIVLIATGSATPNSFYAEILVGSESIGEPRSSQFSMTQVDGSNLSLAKSMIHRKAKHEAGELVKSAFASLPSFVTQSQFEHVLLAPLSEEEAVRRFNSVLSEPRLRHLLSSSPFGCLRKLCTELNPSAVVQPVH